jgi:hypothetical protein
MVGHAYSNVLWTWRMHWTHAKKVCSYSTTMISLLRKVRILIDIISHVEAELTRQQQVLYISESHWSRVALWHDRNSHTV